MASTRSYTQLSTGRAAMASYCTVMPLKSCVSWAAPKPRYETAPGDPGGAAAVTPGTPLRISCVSSAPRCSMRSLETMVIVAGVSRTEIGRRDPVPAGASSASALVAAAETVTASRTALTCRTRRRGADAGPRSSSTRAGTNKSRAASTAYRPGGRSSNTNAPAASVVPERTTAVPVRTRTWAPAMAPPEASTTTPVILTVVCASAGDTASAHTIPTAAKRHRPSSNATSTPPWRSQRRRGEHRWRIGAGDATRCRTRAMQDGSP